DVAIDLLHDTSLKQHAQRLHYGPTLADVARCQQASFRSGGPGRGHQLGKPDARGYRFGSSDKQKEPRADQRAGSVGGPYLVAGLIMRRSLASPALPAPRDRVLS